MTTGPVDEITEWKMYRALVKAETAKRDVLDALADRHAGTPLGDEIARCAKNTRNDILCYEAAGRAAYRRSKEPEES